MIRETIPDNNNGNPRKFKLATEKDHVEIKMKINNMKHKINVKIIQFGVNSNKATTGYKL